MRRDLSEEQLTRLAELRAESARRHRELLDDGPDDALGALAWKAGSVVNGHTSTADHDLRVRIERARDDRFTWREIALALGEGDDPDSVQRVADRQKWRNKSAKRPGDVPE